MNARDPRLQNNSYSHRRHDVNPPARHKPICTHYPDAHPDVVPCMTSSRTYSSDASEAAAHPTDQSRRPARRSRTHQGFGFPDNVSSRNGFSGCFEENADLGSSEEYPGASPHTTMSSWRVVDEGAAEPTEYDERRRAARKVRYDFCSAAAADGRQTAETRAHVSDSVGCQPAGASRCVTSSRTGSECRGRQTERGHLQAARTRFLEDKMALRCEPNNAVLILNKKDVDRLFRTGDMAASNSSQQQAGIVLSAEALRIMLAKLTNSSAYDCQPIPEREPAGLSQAPTCLAQAPDSEIQQRHRCYADRQTCYSQSMAADGTALRRPTNMTSSYTSYHINQQCVGSSMNHSKSTPTIVERASQTDPFLGEQDTARCRPGIRNPHNSTSRLCVQVQSRDVAALKSKGKPPGPPCNVTLTVSGRSSLLVRFSLPACETQMSNVVNRFQVEWSYFDNFSRIVGQREIADPMASSFEIDNLEPGNCYFVRVRAGNASGYGRPTVSTPSGATPSNWRDFEDVLPRFEGKSEMLDDLTDCLTNITEGKPSDSQIKNDSASSKVRRKLKSLFTSSVKLQKSFGKGLYIVAVVHHEGRVLVTNDDVLPAVEVEAQFSVTSLSNEFYWLMKVALSSWYNIKTFQQQLSTGANSATLQFRAKLLGSLIELQSAIGLHDLGQFHHTPVVDETSGSVLFVAVRSLRDVTAFDSTHVRWMSLNKVQKRLDVGGRVADMSSTTSVVEATERPPATLSAMRALVGGAHDMIVKQHLSALVLPRGLYVGFLQFASSIDKISVLVPQHQPNILPYVKVRDNPNVTSEEWRWLVNKKLQVNTLWRQPVSHLPSSAQLEFQLKLNAACDRLLAELGLSEADAQICRLYDVEVLEFNEEVSFLLVLPSVDCVCSNQLDSDEVTSAGEAYAYLPVPVFEMVHQQAYQPDIARSYYQLMSSVDVSLSVAQNDLRQAFSVDDSQKARQLVDDLTQLQQRLEDSWKSARWLADVTCYARDRTTVGLPLGALFSSQQPTTGTPHGRRTHVRRVQCSAEQSPSIVGSDSDYHSDVSSFSVDCPALRRYQPVLL